MVPIEREGTWSSAHGDSVEKGKTPDVESGVFLYILTCVNALSQGVESPKGLPSEREGDWIPYPIQWTGLLLLWGCRGCRYHCDRGLYTRGRMAFPAAIGYYM